MFNRVLILCLLFFIVSNANGKDKTFTYLNKYTINDGLAHNGVTSILEDSRGYLWVATYDGLNKYDGYKFETFRNTLDNDIFNSNRIRTLLEDKKGNIWIGTDKGISIYNYDMQRFKILPIHNKISKTYVPPLLRKLFEDRDENIIVCATENSGIWLLNEDYTFIGDYYPSQNVVQSKSKIIFYNIIGAGASNYILATSKGLLSFNAKTKKFKRVLPKQIKKTCFSITKLDDTSFIATLEKGVAIIDFEKHGDNINYYYKEKVLNDYRFNISTLDNNKSLWLGNSKKGGVVQIPDIRTVNTDSLIIHAPLDNYENRLKVSCFGVGKIKGCWVGTFNKGMYRFTSDKSQFRYLIKDNKNKYAPLDDEFVFACNYDKDRFLITSRTNGLYCYNIVKEKFEALPFKLNNDKNKANEVKAVYKDSRGNVWLAFRSNNNIGRIKPGKHNIQFLSDKQFKKGNYLSVRSFEEDVYNNIWIAGNTGVLKININKNNIIKSVESLKDHPFFKNRKAPEVHRLYSDDKNHIMWIGTKTEGVYRIKIEHTKSIKDLHIDLFSVNKSKKNTLSSNAVTSFAISPNDEFWLGTEGGGICKVLDRTGNPKFIPFTEKNGLSNNVVKDILPDDKGNIWVATNIGLNKFNTKDKYFRTYDMRGGLLFADFWYPGIKMPNGTLVFTGMENCCYFNPKDLSDNEVIPRMEFGEFKLFNKQIKPGDTINNRVLLPKRLNKLKKLTLKYDENVFSIELNSLHFSNPDAHRIKYQLQPVNNKWIEVASDQRYVYSNGLPPGEYTLKVVVSNSFNNWSKARELKIDILPPLWRREWAVLLYILILILISYIILRFVQRLINLKHKLEIEQLEKNNAEEINNAKLRFFSNISHEIKTPLTLITGPVNLLMEKYRNNPDIFENLKRVRRQSRKILQLIDQVHDFQRSEAKLLEMHQTYFFIDQFIEEIITDFKFLAERDDKRFGINIKDKNIYVCADKDKLEKVLNNLLSNAFKYTQANDEIIIEYGLKEDNLYVQVKDTGRGIDESDLPHIFERFYQSKVKHGAYIGGSGIGLAFSKRLIEMHYGSITASSKVHEGTKVILELPVVKEVDNVNTTETENQILKEEEIYSSENTISSNDIDSIDNIIVDKSFSGVKVFLVEDNKEMRNFVLDILSKFFTVETFENGKLCMDAMAEEWPDLVLSDVLMPEMNGFELCKSIKGDIKTSHIPVILLTACTTMSDQIKGLQEGADAYIQKPFNMEHLVKTIEATLKNRKQLRERFKIELPLTLSKDSEINIKDTVFLEKLYILMEENLDNQNIDFNEIARKLYLNRTHFYQKVKAVTNKTPFELIRIYRIKKSAELLREGIYSVNEVFIMTGFKSRSHFTKLFKERYDVTPGKYAGEEIK